MWPQAVAPVFSSVLLWIDPRAQTHPTCQAAGNGGWFLAVRYRGRGCSRVTRVSAAPPERSFDAEVKPGASSTRFETTNNRGTANSLAMLMILSFAAVLRTTSGPGLFPSRL
jgi:hypothetical protein